MNKLYRLLRYDIPMHFVLLITNWLPDNVIFIRLRGRLARPFFKRCGKKLGIGRNVVFYNPSNISIGNDVYIAYGNWFSSSFGVNIEDEVLFGPYNVIATSNHTRLDSSFRFGPPVGGRIIFKKGCWIGANCTITSNVTIGEGSVVGANTLVNTDVPPSSVFAGVSGAIKKKI